jgi:GNAT superfamily N-acetyltransferase
MAVHITAADAGDADAIAALHTDSWRAAYRGILPDDFLDWHAADNRRQLWRHRLSAPADTQFVLKAVRDGRLCGFACTYLDADPAWGALLDNLHVAPDLTAAGIGGQLLRATIARVRDVRANPSLHLWVFEANTRARRFYEQHGGRALEHAQVEVLPAIVVPSVRYGWRNQNEERKTNNEELTGREPVNP